MKSLALGGRKKKKTKQFSKTSFRPLSGKKPAFLIRLARHTQKLDV